MTIKTQWLNDEKQVLVMQFDPRWTWEDIYGMIAESRAMLDSVGHPVGLIIDYRKSIGVPGAAFPNLRALVQKRSPNIAITVMVGLKPQTRAFWELFTRVYAMLTRHRKYQVADSIEDAESLIYATLETVGQGAAR